MDEDEDVLNSRFLMLLNAPAAAAKVKEEEEEEQASRREAPRRTNAAGGDIVFKKRAFLLSGKMKFFTQEIEKGMYKSGRKQRRKSEKTTSKKR